MKIRSDEGGEESCFISRSRSLRTLSEWETNASSYRENKRLHDIPDLGTIQNTEPNTDLALISISLICGGREIRFTHADDIVPKNDRFQQDKRAQRRVTRKPIPNRLFP
jgi:hypothetical protein